jgi:hypothetical protein
LKLQLIAINLNWQYNVSEVCGRRRSGIYSACGGRWCLVPRGMERGTKKAKYGDFLASFLASVYTKNYLLTNMQTRICRFHMCKYGLQIKTWSFCMCICVSAQQNRVFRRKKRAISHFSAKKDGAKPDTVFCKRHWSKKITASATRYEFVL